MSRDHEVYSLESQACNRDIEIPCAKGSPDARIAAHFWIFNGGLLPKEARHSTPWHGLNDMPRSLSFSPLPANSRQKNKVILQYRGPSGRLNVVRGWSIGDAVCRARLRIATEKTFRRMNDKEPKTNLEETEMIDTISLDRKIDRLEVAIRNLAGAQDHPTRIAAKPTRPAIDTNDVFKPKTPQQVGREYEDQLRPYHRRHMAEVAAERKAKGLA